MPSIISRYLFYEVTRTWLVLAAIFSFLTLGLGLSKFIGRAAAGQIPVNTVFSLAFFALVKNLEIVLPVSVFLAVLLVLGRLSRDNELASLFACGAGLGRIYTPFIVFALLTSVFAAGVTLVAKPHAMRAMDKLLGQTTAAMVQSLSPGRFQSFEDGKITVYAAHRDDDGYLRDVFVRINKPKTDDNNGPVVVTADRARQRTNRRTRRVVLVLDHGWRYQGHPGEGNYRIVKFDEYGLEIKPAAPPASTSFNTKSTAFLMASSDPDAIADWQTRVSVPVAILILVLMALPLGQAPPRAGRYGRVVAGILLCVIYINAINLGATAIKESIVAPWVGLWWVHVIALAAALMMLADKQGLLYRPARGRS